MNEMPEKKVMADTTSEAGFPEIKTILFDLDGTLTDPYEGITNSILHSLKYYPKIKTPERETLRPFIGPPLYASYEKYFGMSHEEALDAVTHYREYFRPTGMFENKVYDGIPELLVKLKAAGKTLLVATSKPEEFAVGILAHFGLSDNLDGIVGSTLDGKLIEKKDIIKLALGRYGADEKTSVMIGDTAFDIKGAAACGMRAIGVSYGYGDRAEMLSAGAVAVVDDVPSLADLLLRKV